MEKLIELEDMAIPQDNYKVSIRYNEAELSEYGVVNLRGQSYSVRLDFIYARYIQATDFKDEKETYELMAAHPRGCYLVENSSLLMELHSQGHLQLNIEDSFRRYRHYRIILNQLMIDVIKYNISDSPFDFHIEGIG